MLLSLKRNSQNPRCFDYYQETRALPLHETLLNLEIWKHLEVEAGGPFVARPTWKFLFQKITRSQGGPNVEVLKKFIALKNLMKTGRLVFPLLTLSTSDGLAAL